MPLLKGRVIAPVKPLSDVAPNETIYIIPHTNEQFRSREEFDRRDALYREKIWMCQCTGHMYLTHEMALQSEKESLESLRQQFPQYYEKSVLTMVHHSTESLDNLVDQTWMELQQHLVSGETVNLNVKSNGKVIQGTVVKMDSDRTSVVGTSDSSSPSSDKENHSSGKTTEVGDENPQKKWTPPKVLPYKYSLRLVGQDKVIYGVPATDLTRVRRPPSKDLLRLFIRAYALRTGSQCSPWHVRADMVTKYAIPNKFADLFTSSAKVKEYGQKAMDEATKNKKKRKLSSPKAASSAAKKQKRSPPSSAKQPTLKLNGKKKVGSSTKTNSPTKTKTNSPTKTKTKSTKADSSSEDDVTLADYRRQSDDDDLALSELREKTLSDDDDVVLADLNKTKGVKRKGMKQMTLFEMKKKPHTPKKSAVLSQKSPAKSPVKTPYKQPPLVVRLLKAQKDNNRACFGQLLTLCAKDLSSFQRSRLPASVKDEVMQRWNTIQEHKRIAKMTPAQRKAYMENKREEIKKAMRKRRALQNKRYEDTELDLKPLPNVSLVPTPETFPNELFGDVAMVTEFISCYSGLLVPHGKFQLVSDSLMKALTSGSKGFLYLSQIIMILLQTLLQDPITEHYRELSLPLSDLTINQYTSSELVRLCLRRHDDDDDEDGRDDAESDCEDGEEDQVSEEIIDQLETTEFCDLELRAKLEVLVVLCHHLIGSYAVQDFMTEKQQQAHILWKRKMADMKDKKEMKEKRKKEGKSELAEKVEEKTNEKKDTKKEDNALTLEHFYGRPTGGANDTEEGDGVVNSRAYSRRLGMQQEQENRRRREMEKCKQLDVLRKQREEEDFERTFLLGVSAAKVALRQMHIGCDRHHSRYWLFHDPSPGLYVEKGWAGKELSYQPYLTDKLTNGNESDISFQSESETNELRQKRCHEKTTPPMGQNLWFRYDSVEQLDALLAALHPRGARESALANVLKKLYPDIRRSMAVLEKSSTTEEEPATEEEEEIDMLKAFKQELEELELRLRSGGLGSVADFNSWADKLHQSSTVKECGDCLVECQMEIPMKFRKGLLVKSTKKAKREDVKAEEEEEDVREDKKTEEEVEEVEEEVGVMEWRDAVANCASLSRLHLLLAILDSSIKWEKSAEKAKCKICRKKPDETDTLLLCDGCNQAFHLYCLRPALLRIPDGDWYCPSCQPTSIRRNSRGKNYRQMAGVSEDDEDDDDEVEEEQEVQRECLMCDDRDNDETLVSCSSCSSAFHQHCHQPPLQRMPRSSWRCCQCVSGVRIRAKSKRRTASRKKYSDDYEYGEIEEKRAGSRRRPARAAEKRCNGDDSECHDTKKSRRQTSRRRIITEDEDQEEEEEEENSEEDEEEEDEEEENDEDTSSHSKSAIDQCNGRRNRAERPVKDDTKVLPTIIHRLQRHRLAWPFIDPVDTNEVPDYLDIISEPMDLECVRSKCAHNEYKTVDEFVADVTLVFSNATLYNQVDSVVGQCIEPVKTFFYGLLKRYLPHCYEEMPSLATIDDASSVLL